MTSRLTDNHMLYLAYCQSPRTTREAGEYFGVHWQTARRHMENLLRHGLLEKYPIYKGNEKRYIVTNRADHLGQVTKTLLSWGGESIAPATIAQALLQAPSTSRSSMPGRIIAELAARSFFLQENPHDKYTDSEAPVEAMRRFINDVFLPWVEDLRFLADQMLMNERIWTVDAELWSKLGWEADHIPTLQQISSVFDDSLRNQGIRW